MKTLRRNRIIIALVLLLSLLPMGIVKATHVHDSDAISTVETSGTCHSHNGTADNDCPICQFILSPFVEEAEPHIDFTTILLSFILALPCAGILEATTKRAFLRAPPFAYQV